MAAIHANLAAGRPGSLVPNGAGTGASRCVHQPYGCSGTTNGNAYGHHTNFKCHESHATGFAQHIPDRPIPNVSGRTSPSIPATTATKAAAAAAAAAATATATATAAAVYPIANVRCQRHWNAHQHQSECRGIFVNGLNYKARTKDIENHFGKAGQIAKVDLQKDPQTGKSKGNCTIQYTNAESAARAIAMFHEQSFMTLRLNVRRDKEATPIDAPSSSNARSAQAGKTNPEPIIVNGSQVRQALVSI
jgi:hypothetical protein